jgi:hypothetical protein
MQDTSWDLRREGYPRLLHCFSPSGATPTRSCCRTASSTLRPPFGVAPRRPADGCARGGRWAVSAGVVRPLRAPDHESRVRHGTHGSAGSRVGGCVTRSPTTDLVALALLAQHHLGRDPLPLPSDLSGDLASPVRGKHSKMLARLDGDRACGGVGRSRGALGSASAFFALGRRLAGGDDGRPVAHRVPEPVPIVDVAATSSMRGLSPLAGKYLRVAADAGQEVTWLAARG